MSLRIEATIRVLDLSGAVLIEASEAKMVVHVQPDESVSAGKQIETEMLETAKELHALVERVQSSKDEQIKRMLDAADGWEGRQ